MRLRITLQLEREENIPLNYQYYLSSAVYRFLETADADYARFLHQTGYAAPVSSSSSLSSTVPSTTTAARPRHFKLFTFSHLWSARSRIQGDQLYLIPGPVTWQVASPVEEFLRAFASGLLAEGTLQIASKDLLHKCVKR